MAARNGFTLVELMVALAIFGLLSLAGTALLRQSVDGQAQIRERLGEVTDVQRAAAAMRADFGQAIARTSRNDFGDPEPAFVGRSAGGSEAFAQFVRAGASSADDDGRPDMQKIAYAFDGNALTRTAFAALDGGAAGDPVPLLTDVRSVEIRFRDDRGEWRGDWSANDPKALPRAIELTITPNAAPPVRLVLIVGLHDRPIPQLPFGPGDGEGGPDAP